MRVRFHAPETPRKVEFAAGERQLYLWPFARQVPHWAGAAHLRRRLGAGEAGTAMPEALDANQGQASLSCSTCLPCHRSPVYW